MKRTLFVAIVLVVGMVFTGNAVAGAGKKALKNSGRPAVLERMHRVLEKMDLDANQTAKISDPRPGGDAVAGPARPGQERR